MSAPDNSPFDRIVDDHTARTECTDWAIGEIATGRSPEEVAADLIANGWSTEDAESIAETARRQTRSSRGGTSRQEVASAFGADDPNVMRNSIPFAKPSPFGAIGNLIRAFTRFNSTKNAGKPRK